MRMEANAEQQLYMEKETAITFRASSRISIYSTIFLIYTGKIVCLVFKTCIFIKNCQYANGSSMELLRLHEKAQDCNTTYTSLEWVI